MLRRFTQDRISETLLSGILITGIIVTVVVNIRLLTLQSIRLDESQSLWFASKPVIDILRSTAIDVHVPLYNVLLHIWLLLTDNTVQAARTMSLLFFILTLPFYYIMVKDSTNRKVALLSVILFILSPFILWFSAEARMYTLFVFITTINNLYFLRHLRGQSNAVGFWLTSIIGLYTHYFFHFVLITQFIYILIYYLHSKEKAKIFHWLKIFSSAYIFFVPWILFFLISGGGSQTSPLIPQPSAYNIIQSFINFLFGFQSNAVQSVLVAMWPISLFLLFVAFTTKQELKAKNIYYFLLFLLLPILLGFLASFFRPIFLTRYFIFVTPALFLLLSFILANFSGKMFNLISMPVIAMMFIFTMFQNISTMTPVKEEFSAVTEYLNVATTPQDIVAITAPFTVYPIEYSYKGSARLETIPFWNRFESGGIPNFSEDNLIMQLENYKTVYQRVFVVFSYDQGYEQKVRDYLDQNYELLNTQEYGANIKIRVYKLRYD